MSPVPPHGAITAALGLAGWACSGPLWATLLVGRTALLFPSARWLGAALAGWLISAGLAWLGGGPSPPGPLSQGGRGGVVGRGGRAVAAARSLVLLGVPAPLLPLLYLDDGSYHQVTGGSAPPGRLLAGYVLLLAAAGPAWVRLSRHAAASTAANGAGGRSVAEASGGLDTGPDAGPRHAPPTAAAGTVAAAWRSPALLTPVLAVLLMVAINRALLEPLQALESGGISVAGVLALNLGCMALAAALAGRATERPSSSLGAGRTTEDERRRRIRPASVVPSLRSLRLRLRQAGQALRRAGGRDDHGTDALGWGWPAGAAIALAWLASAPVQEALGAAGRAGAQLLLGTAAIAALLDGWPLAGGALLGGLTAVAPPAAATLAGLALLGRWRAALAGAAVAGALLPAARWTAALGERPAPGPPAPPGAVWDALRGTPHAANVALGAVHARLFGGAGALTADAAPPAVPAAVTLNLAALLVGAWLITGSLRASCAARESRPEAIATGVCLAAIGGLLLAGTAPRQDLPLALLVAIPVALPAAWLPLSPRGRALAAALLIIGYALAATSETALLRAGADLLSRWPLLASLPTVGLLLLAAALAVLLPRDEAPPAPRRAPAGDEGRKTKDE